MILEAFQQRRSNVMVEISGTVIKLLPDDREGDRHQRFILQLKNRHTVLVVHNIDLVERVPLQKHDRLKVRGEYEWNELGGVLHWTHRDTSPQDGKTQSGWIEHKGRRYE